MQTKAGSCDRFQRWDLQGGYRCHTDSAQERGGSGVGSVGSKFVPKLYGTGKDRGTPFGGRDTGRRKLKAVHQIRKLSNTAGRCKDRSITLGTKDTENGLQTLPKLRQMQLVNILLNLAVAVNPKKEVTVWEN